MVDSVILMDTVELSRLLLVAVSRDLGRMCETTRSLEKTSELHYGLLFVPAVHISWANLHCQQALWSQLILFIAGGQIVSSF